MSSRLAKFIGSPIDITLGNETFRLYPLTVKDFSLFKEGMSPEEQFNASVEIIKRSLKDETLTSEEIEALPVEIFKDLMEEINTLNGFNKENAALDRIREAQAKNLQKGGKQ